MNQPHVQAADDSADLFNRVLGQYDVPAYVRRARQVDEEYDRLIGRCQRQRDEWLTMPRLSLGMLHALAGRTWEPLRPLVVDDTDLAILEGLLGDLQPALRFPPAATRSVRALRGTLRELIDGLERFNCRWLAYLPSVDLDRVNQVRADYNRYYLLEKECALRSPILARLGHVPQVPLTREEVACALPVLPVPRLVPVASRWWWGKP